MNKAYVSVLKRSLIMALLSVLVLTFAACGNNAAETTAPAGTESVQTESSETQAAETTDENKITSEEAKNLMDSQTGYVLVDVRSPGEYEASHIEGAINIPDYSIAGHAEETLTDKGQLILVYCSTGRRSKEVTKQLTEMGYTNVKDFGGIDDWTYGVTAPVTEATTNP